MKSLVRSLLLGAFFVVTTVGSASAANVTVRVEGASDTLVEKTQVSTTSGRVVKNSTNNACSGESAAGALESATSGDWEGSWYDDPSVLDFETGGFGYSVDSILGESYLFGSGRYWELWLNHKTSITGVCGTTLDNGDEILLVPSCYDSSLCTVPSEELVLDLELSTNTLTSGQSVEATVTAYTTTGETRAAEGVTVTADGNSVTTGSDGKASLTFNSTGEFQVKAAADGYFRSNGESICVHTDGDGGCGTTAKSGTDTSTSPTPTTTATACAVTSNGIDGLCGNPDQTVPTTLISGIKNKKRYNRKSAPRTISWSIDEAAGISELRLRIRRRVGGKCSYFNGDSLKFKKAKCGTGKSFTVDAEATGSYLLPKRLSRGTYTVDLIAVDKAGNSDTAENGRNRIRFSVK